VDPTAEQAENRELQPLSDLPAESDARVVRLAEHDGDLLAWFYEQGLVPGVEVRVERVDPAADQLTLTVDGERRSISQRAAAGLFVRPLVPAGVA
jgi:Fe2+ transport system protein FeoA